LCEARAQRLTIFMQPEPALVVHVIHHLSTGGLENGLVNLITALTGPRYRHAVVCVENFDHFRERLTPVGTDVIAMHRSEVGVWRLRRDLYALFRKLRPAIVHSRNQSGLDALLPARAAGVRHTVHGEHGWDVTDLTGAARRPALLRRLHSPLVSRYVTVSKDLERYLVRRIGIAPSRITQIYNGVDTARFAPRTSLNTGRASLPAGFAPEGTVVIGTVGRIQAVKDQASLLHALASLRETAPAAAASVRLAIVGGGPLEDELHRLAAALGVAGQTWFAGGRPDVPEMLRAFDVFSLPSLNEGISNTVLEAMATGLPVVATAVGGNVELVADGHTGMLVPAANPQALAAALARYVSDPLLRAEHGAHARAVATARFGLASMVAGYQRVYDDLLATRPERTTRRVAGL